MATHIKFSFLIAAYDECCQANLKQIPVALYAFSVLLDKAMLKANQEPTYAFQPVLLRKKTLEANPVGMI
jgi:hypothetical protein